MTPQQLDAVRAEFPALATNMVFLDNAGWQPSSTLHTMKKW